MNNKTRIKKWLQYIKDVIMVLFKSFLIQKQDSLKHMHRHIDTYQKDPITDHVPMLHHMILTRLKGSTETT